ncbi:MAG: hypothetical protein ACE5OS_06270 [Anaerolineae bacterium]
MDIDLAAENERLRAENAALRRRIGELEERLAELEGTLATVKEQLEEARRAGKRQAAGEPIGERHLHPQHIREYSAVYQVLYG